MPADRSPHAHAATRRRALTACLALAAVALLSGGRYLTGRLPIGVDHTLVMAPWFSLRWQGGPPLFDPYTLSGVPLYDNLQAALLYPLRWPFFFLEDWRDYYAFYVFLHFPIALIGTYALARSFSLRRVAALATAVLFACGGYLAGRPINPAILYASAWLPWLLLGAAGDRPFHRRLTTLAFAMILAIGSPHLFLYGLLGYAVVAWCVGLRAPLGATMPFSTARRLTLRLLHLLLAVALVAPTLIPGVLGVARSVRVGGSVEQNLADSIDFSLLPRVFLGGTGGTVHPEFIDKSCYVGAVAGLLVLSVLFRRRPWRDRRCHAAALLTCLGLLLALGRNIGLHHVLPWIPGLKWLTGPDRALVLPALGLALLAGLALDRLSPRVAGRMGLAALALGVLALALFLREASALRRQFPFAPDALLWLRVWLVAPQAVIAGLFPSLDASVGLLAAAALLLLLRRRPRLLRCSLLILALLQCLHFAPRVGPPMRDRSFYDPPAAVQFLRVQARRAAEPFRIAGYDPLRVHDNEVNNRWLFHFLVPQLSTLFGLEDVQGFDPSIPAHYAELVERTAGHAPINDPLRNLDLAWPDPRLLHLLGVRYLLGHPYDRRVTHLPLRLDARRPWTDVQPIDDLPSSPVTHWSFVSLIDGDAHLPSGAEVARLHVDAAEGRFVFPIRNGVETAHVRAPSTPGLATHPGFRAALNTEWETQQPIPRLGYATHEADWRGQVAFGQPLTLHAVSWELLDPSVVVFIAAQACRLKAPAPEADPWRLAFGAADDPAPVYEFRPAAPRAVLLASPTPQGHADDPLENVLALSEAPAIGQVRWTRYGPQAFGLEVDSPRPALLLLRQPWYAGWRVRSNDHQTASLKPIGGYLSGVDVPAGRSRLDFVFRPRFPFRLMFVAWVVLLPLLSVLIRRLAKRTTDR
jgi:hypothetical protein